MITFANTSDGGRVCLFFPKETTFYTCKTYSSSFLQVLLHAVKTCRVATAFKKKNSNETRPPICAVIVFKIKRSSFSVV